MTKKSDDALLALADRIRELEHRAELLHTVLLVKEPNAIPAANAYDGLRKQIVAAAAERRSHLVQLVTMSVAVSRASSVADLTPQVAEWMEQAGVVQVFRPPAGVDVSDLFEDVSEAGAEGVVEIVEPAYVDRHTQALLRMGRARRVAADPPPVHDANGVDADPAAAPDEDAADTKGSSA